MAPSSRGEHALPPEKRLKERRDFLRIQRRGYRVFGRRFIYYFARGRTGQSRIGVTVSRKVGNAVVRNRIKRLVREVFRQHPEFFTEPTDLVVIAKKGVDDFSYHTIRDEFAHVIPRTLRRKRDEKRPRRSRSRAPRRRSGPGRGGSRGAGGV
ncbi:MAG: ribonuclease P protein component [Myxococcota bacterium]